MTDLKITDLNAYTTPVDTDVLPIVHVSATETKKITWAYIKSVLKTYFDSLYPSGSGTSTGTNTGDNAVNSLYSGLVSNATHTGDVTGATALTIANDAVTYAKMQNVSATDKVLGRSTGGAGDVEEITFTAFMRTLADDADASAMRTTLGVAIGSNVQAYSANLATYAGIAPSANVQTFLGAADYSAMRTQLALVIGTNVQAYNANLTTYAGITPSANVQSILSAANYAAIRTLLAVIPDTGGTFSGDISVPDEAYDATAWNGSLEVPTKNAVRDKIESMGAGTTYYTWSVITGTTQACAVNNAYYANNAAQVVFTLPSTAAVGDKVLIRGMGAGGWKLAQNASQLIIFTSGGVASYNQTTTGTGGFVASNDSEDYIEVVCSVANTTWRVIGREGNLIID